MQGIYVGSYGIAHWHAGHLCWQLGLLIGMRGIYVGKLSGIAQGMQGIYVGS